MSKARLIITAVVVEGRSQGEIARSYGVSKGWVSKLVARYRVEGETAFEPRSRRSRRNPRATSEEVTARIIELRRRLVAAGLDAGPMTIGWHLQRDHQLQVSRATIYRILHRAGVWHPNRLAALRYESTQISL